MPEGQAALGTAGTSTDRVLLDAVLALSSDLDVPTALQRIVSGSCALTGAGRGALVVLDPDGSVGELAGHGMTVDAVAALAAEHPPGGAGVVTGATLEVPVPVPGEDFGRLYLAGKAGGADFTAGDVALVEALAQGAGAMVSHARTFHRSERDRAWLAAAAEVSQRLQDGDGGWDSVAAAAARAGDAQGAVLVQQEQSGYDVVAVEGDVPEPRGLVHEADEVLRRAEAEGEVVAAAHEEASVLVVPLQVRLADRSMLLLSWAPDQRRPDAEETARISGFAESASLSLDRAQALRERQELMLVADRDRIARDLHDLVIQRLFATGLQLQGVRQIATSEGVRNRVDEAVADLDLTIRDIRSTIFALQHQRETSVRAEVRGLVKEYVPVLGFTPLVRTSGPVDGGLTSNQADHLLATLREALSNVARHAQADACLVEVTLVDGWLTLAVADNGRGMPPEASESGLRNARRRALETGGWLRLLPEEPRGTRLEWALPVGDGPT